MRKVKLLQRSRAMEPGMNGETDRDLNTDEDGDFWSVPKTAEAWGVSPKTLWREIQRGALEIVRLGPSYRSVRTTRASRAAYLAARRG